jgi:hypothetical protein
MSYSYELGDVVRKKTERWLVVRIVKSQSLFEEPDGETYTLDEHYIEMRRSDGVAGFTILSRERTPFTKSKGNIKALPPIQYQQERREPNAQDNATGGQSPSEG